MEPNNDKIFQGLLSFSYDDVDDYFVMGVVRKITKGLWIVYIIIF